MLDPNNLLSHLPNTLREELLTCYRQITTNYYERRWEPAELNGGKLCEVVYSIVNGALSGAYPAASSKPQRMADACRQLESYPASSSRPGDRSLRVLIPRLLPFLYEIRNNRGVGHVGGDVNPNASDAEAVVSLSTWVLAELVRIFHGVTLQHAQDAVNALVQRRHPLVWSAGATKRVLDPALKKSEQVLALLYSEPAWVDIAALQSWVEYSSLSLFRTRVIAPLHQQRLLEFDKGAGRARITPLGARVVEQTLVQAV